jgi:tellurite methyltransferase
MSAPRSVEFFDAQFRRQARDGEFALNPFEIAALPFMRGRVLDLGCGLGNLALEAARRGCEVLAIDASPTAVTRIRDTAAAERLPVQVELADLAHYRIAAEYDTIVAIGLLMFFPEPRARELLGAIRDHVRPGGRAIVNVLTEGTTFLDMFDPGHCYLFRTGELAQAFADWQMLLRRDQAFDAPGGRSKVFSTVIAERPRAAAPVVAEAAGARREG